MRYLPQVALATFAVAGLPALIASVAEARLGMPPVASILVAMALSMLFARAGASLWMRLPQSRDIVFADLMVWGWLRRLRAERRLAEAEQLLGREDLPLKHRKQLLRALAAGLEARDSYTHGHSTRVARYSEAIARGMGLPKELVAKVRTAAAVHDVGKIRTPRHILTKPDRLDDAELAVMQRHVRDGAEMVAGLGDPEVTAMVMGHHERLDGSGYPEGLPGEQIALGARIIAVADTFDAMTSSRPYRSAASHKRAFDVLAAESPVRLDARVVASFRDYYAGRRAVPLSALLATAPQRLGPWVAGLLQGEGALPLAQGLGALGAAALLGGSMIGSAASEQGAAAGRAALTGSAPAVAASSPIAGASHRTGLSGSARQPVHTHRGGGSRPRGVQRRSGHRSPSSGGTPPAPAPAPAPITLPAPSHPGKPSSPGPQGGSPGGRPLQPSLSVTPDHVDVGVKVELPPVVPVKVAPVETHVDLQLPKPAQP